MLESFCFRKTYKKKIRWIIDIVFILAPVASSQVPADSAFRHFITRRADTLFDGSEIYRFISFNVPNLHLLEDHFPFTENNNWTLPASFELRDAMQSVADAGGTVIRQYCLRIQRSHEADFVPKHVTDWRMYYEPAFVVMDTILAFAHEYGIRLIIPFLEGPPWWGSKKEFARLRKGGNSFNSPEIREDYKHLVSYLLNRRNTVTGILYKDDKAILCWETGNEMPSSTSWLNEMAAFIKSLDSNHLLMDGNYGVRKAALDNEDIDIVSNHFYKKPASWIYVDLKKTGKRKAYIAGEWGWTLDKCDDVLTQIQRSATANALVWSLRYRHRLGGFTWHKGEGLHWPGGFGRTERDDEKDILAAVCKAAYAIRNIPPVPPEPPAPPHLLPIAHPSLISWQGSARATRYALQRSTAPDTTQWTTVGDSIDETTVAYRPLFSDTTVEMGSRYFYRCTALGSGGISYPSNIVGPVEVDRAMLVDEFIPGTTRYAQQTETDFSENMPWRFKYDFHRRSGSHGGSLEYTINGTVTAVRLFVYFPKKAATFTVAVKTDTGSFIPVSLLMEEFPYCCANPRDRLWLPVLFATTSLPPKASVLRISFPRGKAQIGRCEIEYRKCPSEK